METGILLSPGRGSGSSGLQEFDEDLVVRTQAVLGTHV